MAECNDDPLELFKKTILSVIKDEGFQLPSERAQHALLCAEKLLEWMSESEHKILANDFASMIYSSICECSQHLLVQRQHRHRHRFKEKLWENYYKLCSSDTFRSSWKSFLQSSIGLSACPIFYQYITQKIMEMVIKEQFSVEQQSSSNGKPTPPALDYAESNALRYCAGYVIRSLLKKLRRSAAKEELVLCMEEMMGEHEETELDSENWTKSLNRGGLVFVSDITYMLFYSMEMELRIHLRATCTNIKDVALKEIIVNEDVLFYWSIISTNWDTASSNELLNLMTAHYITIRGFSFVNSIMEKYKQATKSTTQKSKGLRKTLT